jgi:hypothetical protein
VIITVGNSGETPGDLKVTLPADSPLSVSPSSLKIEAGSFAQITVSAPASFEFKGDMQIPVRLVPSIGRVIETTVSIRQASLVDGLRGLFRL